MTATLIDEGLDTTVEDEVDLAPPPPMCEAEWTDGTLCGQKADYICSVKCCGGRVLLCEDCLFEFIRYATKHKGKAFVCNMCEESVILHPNHIRVTGKI